MHPNQAHPVAWEILDLPGKALTLVDDDEIEIYAFKADGTVAATIGTKGGDVGDAAMYWTILGEFLAISLLPDAELFTELRSPAIEGDLISVSFKSGRTAAYRLSAHHA